MRGKTQRAIMKQQAKAQGIWWDMLEDGEKFFLTTSKNIEVLTHRVEQLKQSYKKNMLNPEYYREQFFDDE